jgi:hypothetical protein
MFPPSRAGKAASSALWLLAVACAAPRSRAEAARGSQASDRASTSRGGSPGRALSLPTPRLWDARMAFQVDLGSAVEAAPVLAPDGTAYVATADGVLVAIDPGGGIAWSSTLSGSVTASPVVETGGRVLVATAAGMLHALLPTGKPSWDLRMPAQAATDLVWSPRWGVLLGGVDGALWAYSVHATAAWHTPLGGSLAAAPGAAGSRIVAVTAEGDAVGLEGAARRFRARLGARPSGPPVVLADGTTALVAGGVLYRLDARGGVLWQRPGVEWVSAGQTGFLTLGAHGALAAVDEAGTAAPPTELDVVPSAAAVDAGGGTVCVVGDAGELVVARPGREPRRVSLGRGALRAPAVDRARRRAVVVSGGGTVAAVFLDEVTP